MAVIPHDPVAMHEALVAAAREMAESPDPSVAAQGRANRDISLALIRWHENEKKAGTMPEILATALNNCLAHALAGFLAEHVSTISGAPPNPGGVLHETTLKWHMAEIEAATRKALEET